MLFDEQLKKPFEIAFFWLTIKLFLSFADHFACSSGLLRQRPVIVRRQIV